MAQGLNINFVIDKQHSPFVKQSRERIHRLFNVKVDLGDVFSGAERPKQWICIAGNKDESSQAKEYILALTAPAETIKLNNIWGHPLLTPRKVDEIEKMSCAILSKCDNSDLEISGTELSVMLAQSMIDDMFSKTNVENIDTDGAEKTSGSGPDHCVEDAEEDPDYLDLEGGHSDEETGPKAHLNQNNSSLTSTSAFSTLGANRTLFASASAISPMTTSGQFTGPHMSPFHTSPGSALAKDTPHIVNHMGDGGGSKPALHSAVSRQQMMERGRARQGETAMEICEPDSTSHLVSDTEDMSPQKDQQKYLRNLALSLHYSSQDIDKGLASYSMDDVIVPANFLKTLIRIKAQRHGEGFQNTGTERNGKPFKSLMAVASSTSSPSTSAATASTSTATTTAPQVITVEDYSDVDEGVICMGSVSNDISAIVISSDEESDENETRTQATSEPPSRPRQQARPKAPYQTQAQPSHPQQQHVQQPVQPQFQPTPPTLLSAPGEMPGSKDPAIGNDQASVRPTGRSGLRYIVIDGSNVAMQHGNNKVFSVQGLQICIDFFVRRGHDKITAFVPEWRRYSPNQGPITGKHLLEKLNKKGYVKFTPARRVNGTTIASYDDRYILNLAEKEDGIVVSNDQFRDLCQERRSYQNIVATRLLQFMFVGNHFMPPDDPLGRHGPHLDEFLRYQQQPFRSILDTGIALPVPTSALPLYPRLVEEKEVTRKQRKAMKNTGDHKKGPPCRSKADTEQLFQALLQVFPDPQQTTQIRRVLDNHRRETDLNRLTNYCMSALFT